MGMRRSAAIAGLGIVGALVIGAAAAWAADGDSAEAAEAGLDAATREQILQTIEAMKQTDPDLAREMSRQLELMESGEAEMLSGAGRDTALAAPELAGSQTGGEQLGGPELIGPPVEGWTGGQYQSPQDAKFQEVQADPRMQELQRQVEAGEVSEAQARETMFEVLRDHGVEPNDGHEWGREGMDMEGMSDRLGAELGERGEGFEQAWERMAPEAREQMERMFGEGMQEREGTGDSHMMEREMMERSMEGAERMMEMEREFSTPMREAPEVMRELEAPTREFEAPTREYEAPEHSDEMPEHEYEAPEMEIQHEYEQMQPPQ